MRHALTLLVCVGCTGAPLDRNADGGYPNHNNPTGTLEGTLVYQGPAPPVDVRGRPTGRVVLLLFRADEPPPPRGLATTAVSLQALPASQLFASATPLPDGTVRASAPFIFPGIERPDEYQLRAFYSAREETQADGTNNRYPTGFQPLFTIRNQPVRGDVGGGAVLDPTARDARFLRIPLGTPTRTAEGSLRYRFPEGGSVTRGVTVFLGTPFPTDRPVFHYVTGVSQRFTEARPEAPPTSAAARAPYARATGFLSPEARVLELSSTVTVDPTAQGQEVPSFLLRAGLDTDAERDRARVAGVEVQPRAALRFLETAFDYDGDGAFAWNPLSPDPRANADAHPTLVLPNPMGGVLRTPWLFPLVVLARLHDPTAEDVRTLSAPSPAPESLLRIAAELNRPERGGLDRSNPQAPRPVYPVVLFGAVVPGGDPRTGFLTHNPPWPDPRARELEENLRVLVPPVAFELHGPNPLTDWVALIPPLAPALLAVVQGSLPPHYRCDSTGLPSGRYALNVVSQTGQAWTVPNELSPLALGTAPFSVPSQGLVVRITAGMPAAGARCPTPPER
ncbi:MAG: hypothetical protein HY909_16500 [Deltaproteobacteria bacterium]|nr:hypothetical protein [Deltaproteobacteria bacterium]